MHKGYRCAVIAVVGSLVLAAAPSPDQAAQPGQPKATQISEARIDRIAAALEQLAEGAAPDRGCPDGKENRQSDLCAQWKAADAAADAARWTWWTMLAGMFGLVIGAGTLAAASAAALYAKRAAEHTRAGADEAKRSADNAEASHRAFLRSADVVVQWKYPVCSDHGDGQIHIHWNYDAGGRVHPRNIRALYAIGTDVNFDPSKMMELKGPIPIPEEFREKAFKLYGFLEYQGVIEPAIHRSYFACEMAPIDIDHEFNFMHRTKGFRKESLHTHAVGTRFKFPEIPADE